jgi:NAD(P)-dependent dehydrogenase (short-subunit alcohol dehydrogenase family)
MCAELDSRSLSAEKDVQMIDKRIFITGGASGLGRALGERYARAGFRVCIGDLNEQRGTEVARALGNGAQFLRCDVTHERDLSEAAAWLERTWGGVDIVVNNAGVALAGAIDETSMHDWQWIVDVNLLGVVRGCKVFTPLLKKQRSGHIINVASLSGLVHLPMMSAYSATKAAVVALSETLRLELEPHGIGVSVVCPGFFRTNLIESLRTSDAELAAITRKLVERAPIGAEVIADKVFQGVARGECHIVPQGEARLIWMIKRMSPFNVYLGALRRTATKMLGDKHPVARAEKAEKAYG